MPSFKINADFKNLFPPHNEEEKTYLLNSIKKHGVRDPLVVWKETNELIEGHHRVEYSLELGLDVNALKVEYLSFENATQVKRWMAENQLGRRNVDENQKSYFRGLIYDEEKMDGTKQRSLAGSTTSENRVATVATRSDKTREKVAKRLGVSPRTIENDSVFRQSVDIIEDHIPGSKSILLTNQITKGTTNTIREVLEDDGIEAAEELLNVVKEAESKTKAAKKVRERIEEKKSEPVIKTDDASFTDVEATSPPLSAEEVEIWEEYKEKGYAVAHITEHRDLWNFADSNGLAFYVGRWSSPTSRKNDPVLPKYANPFKVHPYYQTEHGTREEVLNAYYVYISCLLGKREFEVEMRKDLEGKILFCHCRKSHTSGGKPISKKDQRCHADILNYLVNERYPEKFKLNKLSGDLEKIWNQ